MINFSINVNDKSINTTSTYPDIQELDITTYYEFEKFLSNMYIINSHNLNYDLYTKVPIHIDDNPVTIFELMDYFIGYPTDDILTINNIQLYNINPQVNKLFLNIITHPKY